MSIVTLVERGQTKVSFASFRDRSVQKAIDHIAAAESVSVFVGAGISAESGLPPWSDLVGRLLTDASMESGHFATEGQRKEWVDSTLRNEQPVAVAGIAQTLLQGNLARTLRRELYRSAHDDRTCKPSEFAPGPTAHAVAALRSAWDGSSANAPRLKILTTNYDDFLEEAFKANPDTADRDVVSLYWPRRRRTHKRNPIKIHHLHGFLPRAGRSTYGDIILTDKSFYSQGEPAAARDQEVNRILCNSTCLFLGTSFSDPNIIKYIEESARSRRAEAGMSEGDPSQKPVHIALFTRHSTDPSPFQHVEEEIVRSRLQGALTTPVFLDHYADVAQFVYEVRNRFLRPGDDVLYRRASGLLRTILNQVVFVNRRKSYDQAQFALNERFDKIFRSTLRAIDSKLGAGLLKEPIAAAIWLMDPEGKTMTPWVTTDRIHRDPELLQSEKVWPGSRWLAVRSVCEGRFMAEPRTNLRSRWSYLAAFPLLIHDGPRGRLPVGAITMTTLAQPPEAALATLSEEGRTVLREALNDGVGEWLLQCARDTKE